MTNPKTEETLEEMKARGRKEHFEKYDALAKSLGVNTLFRMVLYIAPADKLAEAIAAGDYHLNTIPLAKWDSCHQFVSSLYRHSTVREPGGWSMANSVCVLKHVARHYVVPQYIEEKGSKA